MTFLLLLFTADQVTAPNSNVNSILKIGGIVSFTINNPGTGYEVGDSITISGGEEVTEPCVAYVYDYGVYIVQYGKGYQSGTNVATTTSGAGEGMTVDFKVQYPVKSINVIEPGRWYRVSESPFYSGEYSSYFYPENPFSPFGTAFLKFIVEDENEEFNEPAYQVILDESGGISEIVVLSGSFESTPTIVVEPRTILDGYDFLFYFKMFDAAKAGKRGYELLSEYLQSNVTTDEQLPNILEIIQNFKENYDREIPV